MENSIKTVFDVDFKILQLNIISGWKNSKKPKLHNYMKDIKKLPENNF